MVRWVRSKVTGNTVTGLKDRRGVPSNVPGSCGQLTDDQVWVDSQWAKRSKALLLPVLSLRTETQLGFWFVNVVIEHDN